MKSYYMGIDFLRGLGILFVIILHTAFYFYHDIYDVDLDNPTLMITLIGFLLMFAGLFAMLSGLSHTFQYLRYLQTDQSKSRFKYMLVSGGLLFVVAYLYFIFTGPGIIHFESRSMDESLWVSFINYGTFQSVTLDRLLYVDSLVMLATNVLLLALMFKLIGLRILKPKASNFVLIFAILFMILSYVRIPLYLVYLEARDNNHFVTILLLNWLVAKNNPILPFFAFALFGVWIALLMHQHDFKKIKSQILIVGPCFMIAGILGYILAPETMLERAIDPTWYFIMVTQIGLFMLIILLALRVFDFSAKPHPNAFQFIRRFGVAGLTPFFLESVVSALVFSLIHLFFPLQLGIPGAITYGIVLALGWGMFLVFWEKKHYKYGIEWMMGRLLSNLGESSKLKKLGGEIL